MSEQENPPGLAFRRVLFWLGWTELALASTSLVGIGLLTGAGVFYRYVLNSSIVWSEEVSLFLTNVMVFAGAPAMYKARAYVVLNFFYRKFSDATQRRLSLATWLLAATFGALVSAYGISLYPLQITTTSYILEVPRFYWSLPLIFGAASIALTSLYYFWIELRWTDASIPRGAREAAATVLKNVELSV